MQVIFTNARARTARAAAVERTAAKLWILSDENVTAFPILPIFLDPPLP
jgi:hypothetical protein